MDSLEEHRADELIGGNADSNNYTLEMMLAEFGDLIDGSALAQGNTANQSTNLRNHDAKLRLFEDLNLGWNVANIFEYAGINTVSDLFGLTVDNLLSLEGIDEGSIEELENCLQSNALPALENLAYYRPIHNSDHEDLPTRADNFRSFISDVTIDYVEGPSVFLSLDNWKQHFLSDFSFLSDYREEIESKWVDTLICDIPGLYELIPYPDCVYLSVHESASTILSSSLEHLITDFGFNAAASIIDKLIQIICAPNPTEQLLESYGAEAMTDYPAELLPTPLSWLFPTIDEELNAYGEVEGLFGRKRCFLSIYIATTIKETIRHLFVGAQAPFRIERLILDTFSEQGIDCEARAKEIYLVRNGLGTPSKTLEEVGREFGLTRERVRQIESKTKERFSPLKSQHLLLLRMAMLNIAKGQGSVGAIDSLNEAFIKHKLFTANTDCYGFLELLPEYDLNRAAASYTLSGCPCGSCARAHSTILEIAAESDCLPHSIFFERTGCEQCKVVKTPSIGLFDHCEGVRVTSEYIGVPNNPIMHASLRPTSERALLHAILYGSEKALSFDEMIERIFETTGVRPSKARVGSHAGSYSDCMLWGRGEYIHEKNASFPESLIRAIVEWIVDTFDINQTPILGVEGVYSEFEEQLKAQDVPTQQALFSLLRRIGDKRLKLQEYPWICAACSIGERTSFAKYFYSVLEDNNGFITDEHARVIADKTMAQSFALGGLAEYSPFVINANGGWYDIATAGFDMQGIEQLANEIASNMNDDDIVSTVKIFEDHRERCHSLGVKSYDILYYLIDMIEDDLPIEATRRPHLVKSGTKHMSVREAVRRYVRSSDGPVSYDEIIEEFQVKRGINITGICNALLIGDDIVLTNTDEYWSKANLGLNQDYIECFEGELTERIGTCRKYSNLFYRRDEVLPNIRQVEAPHGLRWNDELLKTVVNNSTNFKVFGEFGSCLVNLRDNPDVLTIEAFYYNLLENDFLGWATFDQFAEHCKSYGIREHYEPEFFDAFDSISADDMSIECIA